MIPANRESFAIANGRARLPYDAEMEYLESTGTQWIDTGLYPTNNATTVVDVQLTRVAVSNEPCRIHIIDSKESWNAMARTIGYWGNPGNTSRIAVAYGSSGATPASYADATNYTTARMKYTIARNVFTIGDLYAHTFAEQAFTSTVSMKLLINAAASAASTAAKLYGWQHYENGVLLQDCVPVRVGSVGYMYDRVSGRLFGNGGTGSFALGPDVN